MKALVLQEFGRMAVEERPDPEAGPGEVLVSVVATGICGSDLHGYTGENGRRVPGQVMGHESVGTVAALGAGTERAGLAVGDTVTFNPVVLPESAVEEYAGREQMCPDKYVIGVAPHVVASFAQLVAVPLRNVVALPAEMPVEYGALVEPLAVAVHAVRRAGVQPGDAVFVAGAGPIGQSVVLALLMAGVEQILVSDVDAGRRTLVERLGARSLDPAAQPAPEQVRTVFQRPADVSIDAVGIDRTLQDCLLATRLGGTVCLVGMGAPQLTLDAYRISVDEHTLVGSFTYSSADFGDAAAWVGTSPPQAAALISRSVPLAEGPEAFAALARHDGTPGKVLVRLDR
jgi:threonine dehydrogenase-like Zn-dependent dehydrogenase